MPTFQTIPVNVEAVQFTGDNWAEMHEFTGHRSTDLGDPVDVFSPDGEIPILWVAARNSWLPVEVGTWIVQGPSGFTPWDPRIFVMSFVEVEEVPAGG